MHDVFISYKSEDAPLAMRVRSLLEANGIPCWIAERDIHAGSNYAKEIPDSIENCKVLVLILTKEAQTSPWIMKELDSAITSRKKILPLLVGHFPLDPAMTFLLTGVQYHDATDNLDRTVIDLLPQLKADIAAAPTGRKRKKANIRKHRPHHFLYFLLYAAVLLIVLHLLGIDVQSYIQPYWDRFFAEIYSAIIQPLQNLFSQKASGTISR